MRRSTLAAEIKKLQARMQQSRFLRIVATILVHEHRKPEHGIGRCECCGSKSAVISDRIPAADLVIDLLTGDRHTAESTKDKPGAWSALCDAADLHALNVPCTRPQLELLNDDTGRHLMASSGNRSGKTTAALAWFLLQWLRRGGRGQRFWLIASTEKRAYRLLEKLLKPNKKAPPLLPPSLVVRTPDSHRATNLMTTLVDGSIIDLVPFKNDPEAERAKSDPIVAGLVDEAAHLPSIDWLVALRGRCLDEAGRLCFATTARPRHFLKTEVIDKFHEFENLSDDDERKTRGEHEGAAWKVVALTILDNPWLDPEKVAMDLRTLDFKRPEVQRDWLGAWVASEGLLWEGHFDPEKHIVTTMQNDISKVDPQILAEHGAAGHVPITGDIVKMLCGRSNPHLRGGVKATNTKYILGSDVNVGLMNSCVLQVTAPPDDRKNRNLWHYWVIDNIQTPRRHRMSHPARLVSIEFAREFDPHGQGSPFKGCCVIADGKTMVNAAPSIGAQAGTLPEWYWHEGQLDCRAPVYRDGPRGPVPNAPPIERNFRLVQELLQRTAESPRGRLHVFRGAGALLRSFEQQLDSGDHIVPVDARSGKWDEYMGPVDAMRYVIYAAANAPAPPIGFTSK